MLNSNFLVIQNVDITSSLLKFSENGSFESLRRELFCCSDAKGGSFGKIGGRIENKTPANKWRSDAANGNNGNNGNIFGLAQKHE